MSFSKYRIAIPAAVFACLIAAVLTVAQTRTIVQGNTGDAFLGITMEDVTASNMSEYRLTDEKGVIVRSVQEGSSAEEASLNVDDVILEFAGQPVWSTRQFSRLISETPVGRSVAITVSRDGKLINLSAILKARMSLDAGRRTIAPVPGDLDLERFLEILPPDQYPFRILPPPDQSRPPRIIEPMRPDAPGDRQGAERSEQRPRLGVETQPLTEQMAEFLGVPDKKGVLVTSVLDGFPSEGKLRAGDVVIGVGDREVTNPADLTNFIRDASGEITIKIIRDKEQISVGVSLASDEPQKGGYRL